MRAAERRPGRFVDEGETAVETVLGLSMTSTGVGWVLLDGQDTDGAALDHDAFDVLADVAADGDFSRHLAAVRGAQAIAASSGHHVRSISVTWTDDADAKATPLLKALPDFGFDNIVPVRLPQAAREWAQAFGRNLGFEKCAVCVIESAAVTVLAVHADDGTVRSSVTHMRESADGLARWLTDVFDGNHWQPDTLFLVGSRGDLELISESLQEALPMPIVSSEDAQLVLARGAALALSANPDVAPVQADAEPVVDKPAQRSSRFRSHAGAATVLVAGAIALFAIGPEFAGQQESGSTENEPSANSSASVTSATSVSSATPVSVRAVPRPAPLPPPTVEVQPLVAAPPPAPAQPEAEALPRSDAARPSEPAQAVATPVVAPVASSQEPLAAPVVAPPVPLAPPPAVAPPAPLAPPPVPPPPPPDPIAVVLSPLFGALP